MKFLHKLSNVLESVTLWFIALALAAMTVVVFAQVVAREISASLPWSEELSRYLMIYLTYLGVSVGVKRKSHIAVEFVTGKFPVKVQNTIEAATNIVCILCCAIIVIYGVQLVDITMMQKSPALRIPMGIAYFSLVLGGSLMIIQFIVNTLDTFRDIFINGDGKEVAS
jgi:TRAP-type C4-dicarboxylate transport system permease small subunit